jgi:hypothetical protein
VGKTYADRFPDLTYEATRAPRYSYYQGHQSVYRDGLIRTQLINAATGKVEKVELIPFGKTILRQASFK